MPLRLRSTLRTSALSQLIEGRGSSPYVQFLVKSCVERSEGSRNSGDEQVHSCPYEQNSSVIYYQGRGQKSIDLMPQWFRWSDNVVAYSLSHKG